MSTRCVLRALGLSWGVSFMTRVFALLSCYVRSAKARPGVSLWRSIAFVCQIVHSVSKLTRYIALKSSRGIQTYSKRVSGQPGILRLHCNTA